VSVPAIPEHSQRRLALLHELVSRRSRLEDLEGWVQTATAAADLRLLRDELAELEAALARLAPRLNASLPWHERAKHADYVAGLAKRARDARAGAQAALVEHEAERTLALRAAARLAGRLGEMAENQRRLSGPQAGGLRPAGG
jgi:hypothetical protein